MANTMTTWKSPPIPQTHRLRAANVGRMDRDPSAPFRAPGTSVTPVPTAPALPGLQFHWGDGGDVIVSDRLGAAWGEGQSPAIAVDQWFARARVVLADLEAHAARGQLHARLLPQLEFLHGYLG